MYNRVNANDLVEDFYDIEYDDSGIWTSARISELTACYARATSCAAVLACNGTECDEATFRPACDGNYQLSCYGGFLLRYDCGREGNYCTDQGDGAYCTGPSCVEEGGYCDGTWIRACLYGTVWTEEDCSRFVDGVCVESEEGEFGCRSVPSIACTGDVSSVCDGDILMECDGETMLKYDCRNNKYRTSCFEDTINGEANCLFPGGQPCDEGAHCENNSLMICFGGHRQSYYCPELGGTCIDPGSGSAYCGVQ